MYFTVKNLMIKIVAKHQITSGISAKETKRRIWSREEPVIVRYQNEWRKFWKK